MARRALGIPLPCALWHTARATSGFEASEFGDSLGFLRARVRTGRDLAKAMDKAEPSAEQARAWHEDLAAARCQLTPWLAVVHNHLKPDALA